MKKERLFLILFIVLSLLVCGFIVYKIFKKPENKELTLYGNIEIREVNLSFRVSGRLSKLFFEEGDYVKKGETIALLDFDTFETAFNEAQAQLLDAKANKINKDLIYSRNLPLCKDFTLSKQDCKNLLTDKDRADADFKLAEARVQNARISLNDAVLKAPNDGIILTRITEPGTVLSAGVPVYSLSLFKPLWARAYISEKDLGRIKPGQKAFITNDSLEGREFQAHIGFISPVAEFTPKTVETVSLRTDLVYRLRVIVDDENDDLNLYLRQGMPVNIRIPLEENIQNDK